MDNNSKKHILFVITQGEWGGAQKYIFDLTTKLSDYFVITVAIGEKNGSKDLHNKLSDTNINVVVLNNLVRSVSPISDILAIFELKKLFSKILPDIVHLNSSKAGVIGSIATRGHDLKVVYTVHGWVFNEKLSFLKKKLYFYLEKITAKDKDSFILLSENDKYIVQKELNINNDKLSVIPIGIDINFLTLSKTAARHEVVSIVGKELNKEKKWIVCVANFYKTKGHEVLINAFFNLNKRGLDLELVLIGDGPERDSIEKLVNKLGISKSVHFTGFLDNASKYLKAFDLFVLSSYKEGLPYTMLEAMKMEVPVVLPNVGGIPNIIETGKNGLLFEPGDSNKCAEAINESLSNTNKTKKMTANAVTSLPDFYKFIDQTQNLYQYLLR